MIITDKIKSIKFSIILTNIFFVLLIVFCLFLPWAVSWYVENMKRQATLAAVVMSTCYPCAPFAGAILIFLKKILNNTLKSGLLIEENMKLLKKITICCIIIAVITVISGKFYMPFLIVSATFTFLGLLVFALRAALGVTKGTE